MSATEPKAAATATLSTRRRVAIWTLVVVASVLSLVSILTMWAQRQLLSNDAWNRATTELIQEPKVQSALSTYVVNQLYANVDVAGQLEQQLPPNLKQLSGPAAAALRQPATNAVEFLFGRPRFQQLFVNTSSVAHQKLVNVLENKTGYGISTGNGVVTLDLHALVQQLGTELGLPQAALAKVPADAGVVTVMRSDQLKAAQTGVRVLNALSVWLLAAVLALYALAIYLARGRRRETLRTVAWAFVLVGLLTLVARRWLGSYAIDQLTSPAYQAPAHESWLIMSSILGQIGRAAILYGVVGAVGAALAGPTRWATATRRWLAPVFADHAGIVWGGVAGAFLLLVLWGPTHALRTWWGVLLLGGLLALGVAALQRQIEAESHAGATRAGLPDGGMPASYTAPAGAASVDVRADGPTRR